MSNRLFYLSIPPNIFVEVAKCASNKASAVNGWTRVIVEKPFGRDLESSSELTRCLKQYLREDQIFRYIYTHILSVYSYIYIYIELMVTCFCPLLFSELIITWARSLLRISLYFVSQILFLSLFGQGITFGMCSSYFLRILVLKDVEGEFNMSSYNYCQNILIFLNWNLDYFGFAPRYFDNYGIIRDIMQNHLLQILTLFAMETPVSLDAEDIRNEKVFNILEE